MGAEAFGYAGSSMLAICLVPQFLKMYRTRSAADLSYIFVAMYIFGLGTTLLFFSLKEKVPAAIGLGMEVVMASILLAAKIGLDRGYWKKEIPRVGYVYSVEQDQIQAIP